MPRLSKIGAACLSAFGFGTGASAVTASYLIVGGGGGGGSGTAGGGGAGGYQAGTTSLSLTTTYTVVVGAGGAGGYKTNYQGNDGSNSVFGTLTPSYGGGGGGTESPTSTRNGRNGASGGGGGFTASGTASGGGNVAGQGNVGGNSDNSSGTTYACGGGGGAGGAGGANSGSTAGNGGIGISNSISGTATYYAGGGGGATRSGGGGTGGLGGGGQGTTSGGTAPTAGAIGTGGGGGGEADEVNNGGNGGSGVIIIAYPLPQKFGGGVVTTDGTNCIHTFNTSGTLSPLNSLTASYLIVAGGGGTPRGSSEGSGGGGAGGLLSGSGMTIDTNSTYLVTVGAGGAASTSTTLRGNNGSNSSFSLVSTSAVGGGGGGQGSAVGQGTGGDGGSGGGGGYYGAAGGNGTSGQGYAGGAGEGGGSPYNGGGGGGAGAIGQTAGANGGNGGVGVTSSISGTSTYYAGGGGGGSWNATGGTGGLGGGGNGCANATAPVAGTVNTGGGGGGGNGNYDGVAGGSGIVIISYAGSTQQMAGGTVTIVGGNVIHTFTSSGYLTPLTFVGNSLRFRKANSAFMNKTYATAPTSRTTMTMSFWCKRGALSNGSTMAVFGTGNNYEICSFYTDDTFRFTGPYSSGQQGIYITNQVFRDPAAWYHFVVVYDTTNATAGDRMRLFVNGNRVTSFSTQTNSNQNNTTTEWLVSGTVSDIGASGGGSGSASAFDGYLAEVNVIDGQALGPNAFGSFNAYGVWQPVKYGGSYGTNGFYLPFTNTANTTALGYDFSPQGNNWTTNNISLTSGSNYDSMTDVPTLTSATAANYATINPLQQVYGSFTAVNGNLNFLATATNSTCVATIIPTSGKWYAETIFTTGASSYYSVVGVVTATTTAQWYTTGGGVFYQSNGGKRVDGTYSAYGTTWATGDVLRTVLDIDAGTVEFYINASSQGVITLPTSTSGWTFAFGDSHGGGGSQANVNFGQQPWVYGPPSGYLALNTYNL